MNETSIVTRSTGCGTSVARQRPGVDAFDHHDARIAAQRQSSCPWPTSSAMTLAAPRCSRTSVKPPVDAPTSSARRPRGSIAERVERVRQLDAAAADVRMIGFRELDARVRRRRPRRLCDTTWPSTLHLAGQDQRAGALARRGQPALDERHVEPNLADAHSVITKARRSRVPCHVRCTCLVTATSSLNVRFNCAARPPSRRSARASRRRGAAASSVCCARAMHSAASARDRSRPKSAGIRRLGAGGVLARGLAELLRRCLRRRGCRPRSETRGRCRRRSDRSRRRPRRRAPAMIAPLTADARMSAPVLRACMARRPSASSVIAWPGACPAACRSIAWPPTMPAAPAASRDDPQRRAACGATIVADRRDAARARAARTLRPAGRRRRGSRCRRRRRRAASAVRAAACRCPSPADRRG